MTVIVDTQQVDDGGGGGGGTVSVSSPITGDGSAGTPLGLGKTYQTAKRKIVELEARVAALQALKEAFHQRSFMLRELVALTIAERSDQAGASGAYEARARRAAQAQEVRTAALRERRPVRSGAEVG